MSLYATGAVRALRPAIMAMVLVLVMGASGCENAADRHFETREFATQEDAGSAQIAVHSATDWSEYVKGYLRRLMQGHGPVTAHVMQLPAEPATLAAKQPQLWATVFRWRISSL